MSFTGFSEYDIKQAKNLDEKLRKNGTTQEEKSNKTSTKETRQHLKEKRRCNEQVFKPNQEIQEAPMETRQQLKEKRRCKEPQEAPLETRQQLKEKRRCNEQVFKPNQEPQEPPIETQNGLKDQPTQKHAHLENQMLLLEKKLINLDEFEARQKLIEEQNRKRKELLSKALADRTKQTQEEAQRLNEIQEEFKKLDAILSGDVRILRKEIEVACGEYFEAQKKYDKIEREFLDAKFSLFQKLEKKQMLTEHLCAIIEKNEERKAEKLTELLDKLNLNHAISDKDAVVVERQKSEEETKKASV